MGVLLGELAGTARCAARVCTERDAEHHHLHTIRNLVQSLAALSVSACFLSETAAGRSTVVVDRALARLRAVPPAGAVGTLTQELARPHAPLDMTAGAVCKQRLLGDPRLLLATALAETSSMTDDNGGKALRTMLAEMMPIITASDDARVLPSFDVMDYQMDEYTVALSRLYDDCFGWWSHDVSGHRVGHSRPCDGE